MIIALVLISSTIPSNIFAKEKISVAVAANFISAFN
jgi:hypothetical protein